MTVKELLYDLENYLDDDRQGRYYNQDVVWASYSKVYI